MALIFPKLSRYLLSRAMSSSPSSCPFKLGDWTPPMIAPAMPMDIFLTDIGRWTFRLKTPLQTTSEQEFFDACAKILATVVGSDEEAKKRIYAISCDPLDLGFCAYVDKETAFKLSGVNVGPDFHFESRINDPRTRSIRLCQV